MEASSCSPGIRTARLSVAAPPRQPADPLRIALSVTEIFLVGWSLVRVGVCSLRGLDVEGCAAVVIVVGALASLTNNWSHVS